VKRTGVDWVTWLADRTREDELFRHDLDRLGNPASRDYQEARLAAGMSRLLTSYPMTAYLAAREAERPPPRHVATGEVLGAPSTVVCVLDFPPRVERHESTVAVYAAGKKITFTAKAEPALRVLLSGYSVELTAVTDATGVDAGVLAGALIKEGVCAEMTEALSSGYTGLIPTEPCLNTR
jgi:hypothetical protein